MEPSASPFRPDAAPVPAVVDSPWEAAALQDQLLAAVQELSRLQELVDDASDQLLTRFVRISNGLKGVQAAAADLAGEGPDAGETLAARIEAIRADVGRALIALQFQDMATQLIEHSRRRLTSAADRVGLEPGTDPTVVGIHFPDRPSPVAQRHVDAGSVELF